MTAVTEQEAARAVAPLFARVLARLDAEPLKQRRPEPPMEQAS